MSKVLLIRHLPDALSFQDKEHLLKHFGAQRVWETRSKRNYIFASFPNVEQAKTSLLRLHQLEIAQRRLVVEFCLENEPMQAKRHNIDNSVTSKHIKEFLKILNSWNPSVNFYQPPPVNVKYNYPDSNSNILINIIYELNRNKTFYTQVLHLMNKMSLVTPFEENTAAINFFKETFSEYFLDITNIPLPESETESELSSDENIHEKPKIPKLMKRKNTLPKTRKRPAAVLSTATLPKVKKKTLPQAEVFEAPQIQEQKKISVVVNQDALLKPSNSGVEIVGELGKFQKEAEPEQEVEEQSEPEKPTITKRELMQNRLSYSDMKVLPVFKNYHPGQPSMRLYIKNLAKSVMEEDIQRIYKRYIENLPEEEKNGFDVRVMQEGRMKGQSFVTFPSVKLAEIALNETNGYILKDKPMVVQFARAAIKKTIE